MRIPNIFFNFAPVFKYSEQNRIQFLTMTYLFIMKIFEKLKKDLVFLSSEGGLTSASASAICNLANERVRQLQAQLDGIRLYSKTMEMPATGHPASQCEKSYTAEQVTEIPVMLAQIGDMYALVGYLREAIKAKDNVSAKVAGMDIEDYLEEVGKEYPESIIFTTQLEKPIWKTDLERPIIPPALTGEDLLGNWTIRDRNRLFMLQARASAIMKYIGQYKDSVLGNMDGPFLKARKLYQKRMANPVDVKEDGQNTIIYRYEGGVPSELIEDTYFMLQKKHRSLQAEINGMLHRLELEVLDANREVADKYKIELAEYEKAYNAERQKFEKAIREYEQALNAERRAYELKNAERDNAILQIKADFGKWHKDVMEKVKEMKIVIPNELKDIYEAVRGSDAER